MAPQEVSGLDSSIKHCRRYMLGGLYTADGQRIDMADRHGGWGGDHCGSLNPEFESWPRKAHILSGKTLFLGHFMHHYGHFLTESLSRFWIEDSLSDFDHIVMFPFISESAFIKFHSFHSYFFNAVWGQVPKIHILTEPTVFDDVTVPEQLWEINKYANNHCAKLYQRLSNLHRNETPGGRIFLSRSKNLRRRATNTAEVEDAFRKFGFLILYPENLSIQEQLAFYANCETIAGFSGSAMHNCVFCPPHTQLIEVGDVRARNGFMPMQEIANQLAEVRASRIDYNEVQEGYFNIEYLEERLAENIESRENVYTSNKISSNISPMIQLDMNTFKRSEVIQNIVSLYSNAEYLEIGVNTGEKFRSISAAHKVGVDSKFLFDAKALCRSDKSVELHETTSDDYFGSQISVSKRFDVIYIDGLHTSLQTLRDFINATSFLKSNGVIVIDDVIPNSYHSSLSDHSASITLRKALGVADKSWMGDVYRVTFFYKHSSNSTDLQQFRRIMDKQ